MDNRPAGVDVRTAWNEIDRYAAATGWRVEDDGRLTVLSYGGDLAVYPPTQWVRVKFSER